MSDKLQFVESRWRNDTLKCAGQQRRYISSLVQSCGRR